jgi:hypothetical protein
LHSPSQWSARDDRLAAKQGDRDKARVMLSDAYGWFSEGFDTADLKDAKALLDDLAAKS